MYTFGPALPFWNIHRNILCENIERFENTAVPLWADWQGPVVFGQIVFVIDI